MSKRKIGDGEEIYRYIEVAQGFLRCELNHEQISYYDRPMVRYQGVDLAAVSKRALGLLEVYKFNDKNPAVIIQECFDNALREFGVHSEERGRVFDVKRRAVVEDFIGVFAEDDGVASVEDVKVALHKDYEDIPNNKKVELAIIASRSVSHLIVGCDDPELTRDRKAELKVPKTKIPKTLEDLAAMVTYEEGLNPEKYPTEASAFNVERGANLGKGGRVDG